MKTKKSYDWICIVMYALFLCACGLLYVFRAYWMSSVQIFHISTEFLCMAVTLVLYRLHLGKRTNENESNRYFVALIVVIFVGLFLDSVSWIIDGAVEYAWLNRLTNTCVFLTTFVHGAVFFEYAFTFVETKAEEILRLKKLLHIIIAIAFAVRVTFLCAGVYFRIDEGGNYVTNDAFIASFFFMPIMTLFTCGIVAGNGMPIRRLLTLLSYPMSTLIMLVIALISFDYANSLIALTLSVILIYCSMFVDVEQMRSNLNESLQMYIAGDAIQSADEAEDLEPSGSLRCATMLFSTLNGFGEDMEAMEPEDAVVLLNHFYGSMNDAVTDHHGRLLEYPGYGIFCIFGDFNDCTDHADAAISAAREMTGKMDELNRWTAEHRYPRLKLGIGIDTGDVVIGTVGSKNHMRYSAIGKHVNLASRTSTYAGDGDIVITENTLKESKEKQNAELIGSILPKGIVEPISVYRLQK